MHSIRSLARKEAWNADEGEQNYNPFARSRKNRRQRDEEDLHVTRTADSVPSRVETERREQNATEYPHPHRAGTAPGESIEKARDYKEYSGNDTEDRIPETVHEGETSRQNSKEKSDDSSGLQNGLADKEMGPSPTDATTNGKPTLRQRMHLGKRTKSSATGKSDMSESKKKKHKHIPAIQQLRTVLFGSWINLLLLIVPVGFALRYAPLDKQKVGVGIFVVNFIAIIPLAATLSFATEEVAMYVGETLGGLLNASFGNATELIVSVIALQQKKIVIVQTSLIGSMLSNLLLVLGMCFLFGGITRVKQHFNITVAQTASSLLALAIGSLIIPTAFVRFGNDISAESKQRVSDATGPISYGTSIILLLVYGSYLFFQLKTHTDMYNEPSKKGQKRPSTKKNEGDVKSTFARMGLGQTGAATAGNLNEDQMMHNQEDDEEDEKAQPSLTLIGSLVTLTVATVLIAFCSDFMVSGIDSVADKIPPEFIGLILIPIVGNAAEHATAVTVACKDKMDLAIGVAVGSSIQIALLVFPLVVVIGWFGVGGDALMSLSFDGFQVTVLFIAVLLVNYLIQDGESHWLEGVLLCSTYIIIALSAFYYPITEDLAG